LTDFSWFFVFLVRVRSWISSSTLIKIIHERAGNKSWNYTKKHEAGNQFTKSVAAQSVRDIIRAKVFRALAEISNLPTQLDQATVNKSDSSSAVSSPSSTFWQDRPTFVTGATGLLGSWLVRRLLQAGADVTCLVRDWVPQSELVRDGLIDKVKVVRGDVRDQAMLERALGEYETNTVIHLAAQTIVGIANRNPVSTFETNVAGTWCLLEACRRSPAVKQIVVASSDKAYGEHEELPYSETAPLAGNHPYDVSKSCADLIAQTYATTYELPVAVTRCGNFYGGGDLNWNRIVPGTIRSILREQRPVIRSDGEFVRDYFYAEDGAAANMLLAESMASDQSLRGQAFNFSNEIQVTVLELVNRILESMGSSLEPEIRNEATNEIRHQYLSAAKARRRLGWSPLFTLDEGLRLTIQWYKDFLGTNTK
jgi:CDP-glucose 4,6-dehydratase